MVYLTLLLLLIWSHCLADYPLQGPYISEAKNRNTKLGEDIWWFILPTHAAIHAGFVGLLFAMYGFMMHVPGWEMLAMLFAGCELFSHTIIDYDKCDGELTHAQDQLAHIFCKVVYVIIFASVVVITP